MVLALPLNGDLRIVSLAAGITAMALSPMMRISVRRRRFNSAANVLLIVVI